MTHRIQNLCSAGLECVFTPGDQLLLSSLVDRTNGKPLLAREMPFCVTAGLQPLIFEAEAVPAGQEGKAARFSASGSDLSLDLQVVLDGQRLAWQLDGQGQPQEIELRFPFVSALDMNGAQAGARHEIAAQNAPHYLDQKDIFRELDYPLPLVWLGENERTLTFIIHQAYGEPVYSPDRLWTSGINRSLTPEKQKLFSGELILHAGGLQEAFAQYRSRIRDQYDLSQYQRPDLKWTQNVILQHFTFLYGREILDLDTGVFNIDRLLAEAECSFGGYDSLVLWGGYPRLGIDERSQWDYYDDLPGGRPALRELGARAHARGVRIFLPYLPWERSGELHGQPAEPHELELARLVQDLNADGVFLDCMAAIRDEFREAFDQAKAGVQICSEGRAKGQALQVITASWEQSQSRDWIQGNWSASKEKMPGVDLWRFIFPEHRLFVISRFTTADDRKRIIRRGFFNGMGWVVWQDVFGLALPFTPDEAALLKKCRTILRDHHRAVWGSQPTPLVPVLQPGVCCNEFQGERERLWTFYNSTTERVEGPLLPLVRRPGFQYRNVWADQEIQWEDSDCLPLSLDPLDCGAVAELPE